MMKKKEIVARYFDSVNDKPSGIRFEVLALELLADIRDELTPMRKYFSSLHVVQEKEDKR